MEQPAWTSLLKAVSNVPQSEQFLFNELIGAAVRYGQLRANWRLADGDERRRVEDERTRAHDLFIDACNALSRACARAGESTDWRAAWGEARTGEERRRIGDFACFIAYQLMLEAR
jgi:hypothetical protein